MFRPYTGFTREPLSNGKVLDTCEYCTAWCICEDDYDCQFWEKQHVRRCKASPDTLIFRLMVAA